MVGNILMVDKLIYFGKGFENTNWILITPRSCVSYLKADAIAACFQRVEKIPSDKRKWKINSRTGIKI
jgi:hypothetical protein